MKLQLVISILLLITMGDAQVIRYYGNSLIRRVFTRSISYGNQRVYVDIEVIYGVL